jgi:hypothetical protein
MDKTTKNKSGEQREKDYSYVSLHFQSSLTGMIQGMERELRHASTKKVCHRN